MLKLLHISFYPYHLMNSHPNLLYILFFFFFNDTATTEIYTLSLHDALPIFAHAGRHRRIRRPRHHQLARRSEEHTSELQSPYELVCRLLLEKKKRKLVEAYAFEIKKAKGHSRDSVKL